MENDMAGLGLNDDMYMVEELVQQDPYNDNRTTQATDMRIGSKVQDWVKDMEEEQALVDNSLDFIPGSKLSELANLAKSSDARNLVANGARKYGTLTGETVSTHGISKDLRNMLPIVTNIKESARGIPRALYDIGKGNNYKPNLPKKPGFIRSTMLSGDPDVGGFYANANHGNWGNLPPTIATKSTDPKFIQASTKIHEKDHFDWDRNYGGFYSPNIPMNKQNVNQILINQDEYLGSPWEINARAKQLDDYYAQIKNNPKLQNKYSEEVEYLEDSLEPYMKTYSKKFPNEFGAKFYNKLATEEPSVPVWIDRLINK